MIKRDADHQVFLEHWKSLRADGDLLLASQTFLDHPHPLFAANTLVLDVYPDDLVIRLQATELVERWGKDLTGHSLFDAPMPMNRKDMLINVSRLMDQPCGLLSVHITRTSSGRALVIETLGLPLAMDADKPRRMVNYSWLVDRLVEGERSEAVSRYERQAWIDIGAGVPAEKPLKPMVTS